MQLLNKIVILLLAIGFYSPAFAAVDSFEPVSCSVFSEAEEAEGGDKKTEEEEEPDCE